MFVVPGGEPPAPRIEKMKLADLIGHGCAFVALIGNAVGQTGGGLAQDLWAHARYQRGRDEARLIDEAREAEEWGV